MRIIVEADEDYDDVITYNVCEYHFKKLQI